MANLNRISKSRDITLPAKICLVKAMVFPVVLYGCEGLTIKKAEPQRIDAFESWFGRTFESPLDGKEIQSVHPKTNKSWIFIEKTNAEAETLILWTPDAKTSEKTLMLGKIEGGKRRYSTHKMVGWHHRLDGHEFEYSLGVVDV